MAREPIDPTRGNPETTELAGLLRRLGIVSCRRAADSTLRFLQVDGPCLERMGLSRATLTGDAYSFWTRVDSRDRRHVLSALEDAIRKGAGYRVAYRVQASDGRVYRVREEGAAVRGPDGEVVALDGVILDAADELAADGRQQVESDLVDARQLLSKLGEQSDEMIAELSPDGLVSFASARLCEELLRTEADLKSCDPVTLVHPDDRDHVVETCRDVLAAGESADVLCRLQRVDGSWLWAELRGCAVPSESGELRGVITGRNVDHRLRMEEALIAQRRSEERIGRLSRRFIELGSEGLEEAIQEAIEAAGSIGGVDRCYLLAFPSRRNPEIRTWAWQREGFEPWQLELGDDAGRRNRWVQERLKRGEIVRIPRCADLPDEFAPAREHLVASGIRSYCGIPVLADGRLTAMLGFQALSAEHDWSEQELALLRLVAELLSGALRRRDIEVALQDGERRLQVLAETAQDAICETELLTGTILYANPRFYEMHGYAPEDCEGSSSFDFMHPEDLERTKQVHEAFVAGRLGPSRSGQMLYRGKRPDGRPLWLEANGHLYLDGTGEPRSASVIRDVTDRELAQERMRRRLDDQMRVANLARELLDLRLEQIDEGVTEGLASLLPISGSDRSWLIAIDPLSGIREEWEWKVDGVPDSGMSVRGLEMADFPHARTLLEGGREIVLTGESELPPDSPEMQLLAGRRCSAMLVIPLLSRRTVIGAVGFEMVDRDHAWTDESIALLRLGGEIFASAVSRKRAEEALRESRGQLLQAQKMEAVGTLAGGVAHDFNNQLSVILGNARFVRDQVSEDEDLCEAMTDLERAGDYCAQLTRQLLSFSRHVPAEPCANAVSKLLRDVAELTGPMLSRSIEFEVSAHDDLDAVFADRTQLQQVLVNLVMNARDAMPDGGRVSIRTESRRINSAEAERLRLPRPGEYVQFVVADTGMGIDEKTLARIFEPFFTTKEQGKGTGLGLATVYGILQQSGGAVWADSSLGVGTTFRLLLPRVMDSMGPSAERAGLGRQGGETVLLVEDDESVRRLMRRMLGRMGFQVLEAADGEQALRLSNEKVGDIDVLVSDVTMPGMSGVELGRRLLGERPTLHILLVTGNVEDDVSLPGARILCKPFREEELSDALDALFVGNPERP